MSNARYPEWQAEVTQALIAPIVASEPGPVLLCLQAVQGHFGYVPGEAVAMIAEACNVSRADVHGVFTFYADLRDTPPPLRCRCACAPPRPVRLWVVVNSKSSGRKPVAVMRIWRHSPVSTNPSFV